MENLNHEDKLIKDALMEVSPPDVDASWARMENMLDQSVSGPVVADYSITKTLLRQKIWLSSIFLFISGSALVGSVISKDNQPNKPLEDQSIQHSITLVQNTIVNGQESGQSIADLTEHVSQTPESAHTYNEDMADRTPAQIGTEDDYSDMPPVSVAPDRVSEVYVSEDRLLIGLYLLQRKTISGIPFDMSDSLASIDMPESIGIGYAFIPNHKYRVGVVLDINTGPGFAVSRIPYMTQVGFFINMGRSPVHTFQAEVLYNQLPVSPMKVVRVSSLPFGNSQTDSITIRKLNFVSIPVMVSYNLPNNWTMSFGPQISFLTGLTGDKKTISSVQGEETKEQSYVNLDSKYGMKPQQFQLVFGVGHTSNRFTYRARIQYGITNIAVDNNSLKSEYRNHTNFTFGVGYTLR